MFKIHELENDTSKVLLEVDVKTLEGLFATYARGDACDSERALIRQGFTDVEAQDIERQCFVEFGSNHAKVKDLCMRHIKGGNGNVRDNTSGE